MSLSQTAITKIRFLEYQYLCNLLLYEVGIWYGEGCFFITNSPDGCFLYNFKLQTMSITNWHCQVYNQYFRKLNIALWKPFLIFLQDMKGCNAVTERMIDCRHYDVFLYMKYIAFNLCYKTVNIMNDILFIYHLSVRLIYAKFLLWLCNLIFIIFFLSIKIYDNFNSAWCPHICKHAVIRKITKGID